MTKKAIATWSRASADFRTRKAFARMIGDAGFVRPSAEPMLGGLVSIHSGWKI